MADEALVPIRTGADVLSARQAGRALGMLAGMTSAELTFIATAISEISRNIVLYAKSGEVAIRLVEENGKRGVVVVARDDGPGIVDVGLAMQDGYSSSKGLGLGLPGARRMVDEFEIESTPGKGTVITMKKWSARGR